jgi:DNA invertase Pin-like site-specific DNA recombinase
LPTPDPQAHLVALQRAGEHSSTELDDLFGAARSTVYRAIERDQRRQQPLNAKPSAAPPALR